MQMSLLCFETICPVEIFLSLLLYFTKFFYFSSCEFSFNSHPKFFRCKSKEYSENPKDLGFHEHDVMEIASKAILKGKYGMECINTVWEQICKFIESNMFMKRAVNIRDFGLFTFYEHAIPNTATYSLWFHRPLFLMDRVFCESYDLKCVRVPPATKTVTVYPNYTAIGSLAPCSRFNAEEILSGVVKAVRRLCAMRENFKLDFPHLGTLYIRNRYVDMRFSCKFINKLHRNVINPTALARDFRLSQLDDDDPPRDSHSEIS